MSQAVWSRPYTMSCRHRAAAALLLLLLSFYPSGVHTEYTSQSLSMHLDTLLAEYDREVPPTAPAPATDATETSNSTTPLTVAVSLDVRHASVDDHQSVMRLLADLKMSWNDSRLMWNATEWEASSVLVSGERLWTPDVTLLTAGGGGGAGDAALRARLVCTGGASLVLRLDLSVPIALDLVSWPRDVQEAVFKFASRAHSDDEIQLVIEEYKNVLVVECGAWEVASVSGVVSTWSRADGSAASTAEWSVRVARRGAAQAAAAAAVLAAATALLAAALTLPFSRRAPLAACVAFVSAAWCVGAACVERDVLRVRERRGVRRMRGGGGAARSPHGAASGRAAGAAQPRHRRVCARLRSGRRERRRRRVGGARAAHRRGGGRRTRRHAPRAARCLHARLNTTNCAR